MSRPILLLRLNFRVQLDVLLEAPLIIVPVHSRSRTTFMADLGTLKLTNSFAMVIIFSELFFLDFNGLIIFLGKWKNVRQDALYSPGVKTHQSKARRV